MIVYSFVICIEHLNVLSCRLKLSDGAPLLYHYIADRSSATVVRGLHASGDIVIAKPVTTICVSASCHIYIMCFLGINYTFVRLFSFFFGVPAGFLSKWSGTQCVNVLSIWKCFVSF